MYQALTGAEVKTRTVKTVLNKDNSVRAEYIQFFTIFDGRLLDLTRIAADALCVQVNPDHKGIRCKNPLNIVADLSAAMFGAKNKLVAA